MPAQRMSSSSSPLLLLRRIRRSLALGYISGLASFAGQDWSMFGSRSFRRLLIYLAPILFLAIIEFALRRNQESDSITLDLSSPPQPRMSATPEET